MKIQIFPITLTDGSRVFNVMIHRDKQSTVVLEAISEKDAQDCAWKIELAIHQHTNETIDP